MKSKLLPFTLFLLLGIAIFQNAKALPPTEEKEEVERTQPGLPLGYTNSYWLAPYVKVSEDGINVEHSEDGFGGHGTRTVTWFSQDGRQKTLAVSRTEPGFVELFENSVFHVMGVSEPWKCDIPLRPLLPHKAYRGERLTSTKDSRTLLDVYTPDDTNIKVDVYIHGLLTNTLGPFVQHFPETVTLHEDGSTAMLIWKDSSKTIPQLVCADRNGAVRFRIDCPDCHWEPLPAPDGVAALLSDERGGYTCYTREGQGHTVTINGQCVGWIPGTLRSLFTTRLGSESHFHMIDWDSGSELWDIPCPGEFQTLAVTITPRLVIFAVDEWSQPGDRKELITSFYAVRTEDGRRVARWQTHYPSRLLNGGRFVVVKEKLYYLGRNEFSELSEDDIIAGKNGWTLSSGKD